MYKNYNQILSKVEQIIQTEESKRLAIKKRNMISTSRSFWDTKGECFKISQSIPELQRAMNANDIDKVIELCLLNNKRLSIIFHEYRKK